MVQDEDLLLALLNSAPVIDGTPTDTLAGAKGEEFIARFGGTGSTAERTHIRKMRGCLHDAIRGRDDAPQHLASALDDTVLVPEVTHHGLNWELRTHPDKKISARAAIAWSRVLEEAPGRLRACANDDCNLFLIDRSRPGTAKWCSMATCGNRMKARAHANRKRGAVAQSLSRPPALGSGRP
jgi:predicted RNA-binding Zn ribbon-like protein